MLGCPSASLMARSDAELFQDVLDVSSAVRSVMTNRPAI